MSTKKPAHRRKALAVGIAVVGVAGLSLASAAQLNLVSDGAQFQSGVDVVANCQPANQDISVSFSDPSLAASGYASTSVVFSGIAPACFTKLANVAVATTGGLTEIASALTVSGATLTVALPTGTTADAVSQVAFSIHD